MLIYEDFVSKHYDALYKEDSRLSDLPDEAMDEAVYIWLNSHKTWFEDIYPATFSRGVGKIATEMLFGKAPSNNKIVANLFIAMAEDAVEHDKDDLWWSEALETHLDSMVNLGNFADDLRDRIYLYLEHTIEEAIFDEFAKQKGENDREHGIYD
tara:strand:+ start:83 stop:544 length:462 start_codon:yes stop_codon:yes gene_type:complete